VIFIDEIDAVRGLPFSTDEFFAAIRECYNRRTQDPLFERLTFCLLGVATPSDLIRDTRTTPFNIGRRIELTDFSETEAAPMRAGLVLGSVEMSGRSEAEARRLFDRVFYWTGGHPYLTQRLCQAVAEDPTVKDRAGVDRHSHALFLSSGAQERDDNLIFARARLLRPATDEPERFDLAALLELYGKVCRGERVPVDDTNPLVDLLRLSGVVRVADDRRLTTDHRRRLGAVVGGPWSVVGPSLAVRNRIYARVFDRAWVNKHMPDAELQRQKAAYRRGLLRASAVATAVVVVMAGLAGAAVREAHRADRNAIVAGQNAAAARAEAARANEGERQSREAAERERRQKLAADAARGQAITAERSERTQRQLAERQKQLADERRRAADQAKLGERRQRLEAQRLLYDADMDRVYHDWSTDPLRRTLGLLEEHRPRPGEEDLRGFEWFSLWRLCHLDRFTLEGDGSRADVAFSPDGRHLVMATSSGMVKLYEPTTGRELQTLSGSTLRGLASGGVAHAQFSADGKVLTTVARGGTVRCWDLPSGRETRRVMLGPLGAWNNGGTVALSPDGRMLAAPDAADKKTVTLRDLTSGRVLRTLKTGATGAGVFSPDGAMLATGAEIEILETGAKTGELSAATLWDVRSGRPAQVIPGPASSIMSLAFSTDGRRLAMGNNGGFVTVWDVAAGREIGKLDAHQIAVKAMAFSADGRKLATAGRDDAAKIWDLSRGNLPGEPEETFQGHGATLIQVAFSPNGKALATASMDRTVKVWDVTPPGATPAPKGSSSPFTAASAIGFSPDGKLLATGGQDHTITLWDVATRREVRALPGDATGDRKIPFSRDGKLLAAESREGTVAVLEVATGREVRRWEAPDRQMVGFALSPDGKLLATRKGTGDVTVTLWEVTTGQRRWSPRPFKGTARGLRGIAFSPDARSLAVFAHDVVGRRTMVYLLDAATGRTVRSLDTARFDLARLDAESVAFSADGRMLAAGGSGLVSGLWDVATGRCLGTLRHPAELVSISFSPDGRRLVTAGADGAVRLWDVATAREVCTLATVTNGAFAASRLQVAFSPDGRRLAACARDQVWLWKAASPAEVAARETREKAGAR
jgi:WD40 repeat protein